MSFSLVSALTMRKKFLMCSLFLLVFCNSLPAAAVEGRTENDEALREEIGRIFTTQPARDYVRNTASSDWLRLVKRFTIHPDARLFFLADSRLVRGIADGENYDRAKVLTEGPLHPDLENQPVKGFSFEWTGMWPADTQSRVEYDISPDWNHTWVVTYEATMFVDESKQRSLWCLISEGGSDRYATFIEKRIMRAGRGGLEFLTPPLPVEEEFFTAGGFVYPKEGQLGYKAGLTECEMEVSFEVNSEKVPFEVTAVLMQQNVDNYTPAYLCTPECSIPYIWDGKGYVRGERVCKAAGEWGVALPPE